MVNDNTKELLSYCPLIGQQRPSVLVVDDDTTTRRLLRMRLERQGCRVLTAEHGEQALAILTSEHVHIAIIDIAMPVMDGITLLGRIRSEYPLLRCVILTASTSMTQALSVMELGASCFLVKPVGDSEIAQVIRLLAEEINCWLNSLARIRAAQKQDTKIPAHGDVSHG